MTSGDISELFTLSAVDAARGIREGAFSSSDLVRACLDRVDAVDGRIHAWAHLDADLALAQAAARDREREHGNALGALHGLPIGLKDIFDTADLPTEYGTTLDQGRRPAEDCRVVELLKDAGAVIMGKTVTTELALNHPGKTVNPHDPDRTPGGSSMGSAAATASHQVPLAVGTQTGGSMIRPAAFCGVIGFKPTYGSISRVGVHMLSRALDHVGTYGRSVADAALLADGLMVFDGRDSGMRLRDRQGLGAMKEKTGPPRFAFVRSPVWDAADPETQRAFEAFADSLGDACEPIDLPSGFEDAVDMHTTIMQAEMAVFCADYYDRGKSQLSAGLIERIEAGLATAAADYVRALEGRAIFNERIGPVFDRFDAILTPAAPGIAPADHSTTGDAVFNKIWTYLGTPAVSLPLLTGAKGLPIGVQLVGRCGEDADLLRTAERLAEGRLIGRDPGADPTGPTANRGTSPFSAQVR